MHERHRIIAQLQAKGAVQHVRLPPLADHPAGERVSTKLNHAMKDRPAGARVLQAGRASWRKQ